MKKKLPIVVSVVLAVLAIIIIFIYNNVDNNNIHEKDKIIKKRVTTNQKKNYDFNGKNIVCDKLVSIDNEAMYINDGNIYYIIYNNQSYKQHELVKRGIDVGIEDNKLAGYYDKKSIIDENYAYKVPHKNYVIYKEQKKEESNKNNDNIFNIDDTSNNFYRGSGYSGASNKAVYLKDKVAYFMRFDGDNLVSQTIIATNVDKIDNLGTSRESKIVVYISSNTKISDEYKDYEINKDEKGNEYIIIC